MNQKHDIQKQTLKWLTVCFLIIAALILLYEFRRFFVRIGTEPVKPTIIPEPEAPVPLSYFSGGYYGGGGGTADSPTDESMTFGFMDLLEETFSHNKGRYVTSEIVNEQGEEINLATTQTFNDITLQSNQPVTGTLIIL